MNLFYWIVIGVGVIVIALLFWLARKFENGDNYPNSD